MPAQPLHGAAFAKAVGEVGLQVYPGLFWPPATTDPAGDVVEALTLLRDCWLPNAGPRGATSR